MGAGLERPVFLVGDAVHIAISPAASHAVGPRVCALSHHVVAMTMVMSMHGMMNRVCHRRGFRRTLRSRTGRWNGHGRDRCDNGPGLGAGGFGGLISLRDGSTFRNITLEIQSHASA